MAIFDRFKDFYNSVEDFVSDVGQDIKSLTNKSPEEILQSTRQVVRKAPVTVGGNLGVPKITNNLGETLNLLFPSPEEIQKTSREDLLKQGFFKVGDDTVIGIDAAFTRPELGSRAIHDLIDSPHVLENLLKAKSAGESLKAMAQVRTSDKIKHKFALLFPTANTIEDVKVLAQRMQREMTEYSQKKLYGEYAIEMKMTTMDKNRLDRINRKLVAGEDLTPREDRDWRVLQVKLYNEKYGKAKDPDKGFATIEALSSIGILGLGFLGGAKNAFLANFVEPVRSIKSKTGTLFGDPLKHMLPADPAPSMADDYLQPTDLDNKIVHGYNFDIWNAKDPDHASNVFIIYNSLRNATSSQAIQKDIEKIDSVNEKTPSLFGGAPRRKSDITGDMIWDAAISNDVDPRMLAAVVRQDSGYGTRGLSAMSFNASNIGTFGDKILVFKSWEDSLDATAKFLKNIRTAQIDNNIYDVDIGAYQI